MTPLQCRMARAALRWSAEGLGQRAGLTRRSVCRFETEGGTRAAVVERLAAALTEGGVRFDDAGDWLCVSVLKATSTAPELTVNGRFNDGGVSNHVHATRAFWGIAEAIATHRARRTAEADGATSEYYLSRASDAGRLAKMANDPRIASIHRELWRRYMSLAEILAVAPDEPFAP